MPVVAGEEMENTSPERAYASIVYCLYPPVAYNFVVNCAGYSRRYTLTNGWFIALARGFFEIRTGICRAK